MTGLGRGVPSAWWSERLWEEGIFDAKEAAPQRCRGRAF